MKIRKSRLVEIIREELVAGLVGLSEAPKLTTGTADDEKKKKEPPDEAPKDHEGPPKPKRPPKEPEVPEAGKEDEPEEVDGKVPGEDGADPEPPEDAELDEPADGERDADKKVADELVGKTVQSVTVDPKSKTLPGATEIVFTWDQSPDPLKILVTKTGKIAYFFRGLHNSL